MNARPVDSIHTIAFDKETLDREAIASLFEGRELTIDFSESGVELCLRDDRALSLNEIGRLLILNGKCRQDNLALHLNAPPSVTTQLESLEVHRICFIETLDPASTSQ